MRACTEYIATVPTPRTPSQKNQAMRGRVWVSGMSSESSRARSLPNDVAVPGEPRGSVVATSTDDVGAVADAGLGDHDSRRRRIALDLAAKIRDVHTKILLRA